MEKKFVILLFIWLVLNFCFVPDLMGQAKHTENVEPKKSASQLIQELNSDSELIRARAIEQLSNTTDERVMPYIIESLKDKSVRVRLNASIALGKLKDKKAVPFLIECLKNKEENLSVKMKSAETLVNIGTPEAFQPLVDVLQYESAIERKEGSLYLRPIHIYVSEDEYAEEVFRDSLEKFVNGAKEKESYITALTKIMKDKHTNVMFKYHLALTLGKMNVNEISEFLIECLENSPRGSMRAQSAYLLGRLKEEKTIPALKQALTDPYLSKCEIVTENVGRSMLESMELSEGKEIFSSLKLKKEEAGYRIYHFAVRDAAAAALKELGYNVVKKGNTYKVIER